MSTPVTDPAGPTARAKASVVAPAPQPMSRSRAPGLAAASASSSSVTPACSASSAAWFATQLCPCGPFQKARWPALSSASMAAQPSIASSSSIIEAMRERPLSQNFGSLASRPKGARSALWCFEPPASSRAKYFSWKAGSPSW